MDPLGKSSHFLPIHSLPISFREWCTFFLNTLTFIGKLLSFLERRKKKKKKICGIHRPIPTIVWWHGRMGKRENKSIFLWEFLPQTTNAQTHACVSYFNGETQTHARTWMFFRFPTGKALWRLHVPMYRSTTGPASSTGCIDTWRLERCLRFLQSWRTVVLQFWDSRQFETRS